MKSIGSRMYAIAPPTSSLSVLATRLSAIKPPSKRRKFGSSFIVEMMVRLASARGDWRCSETGGVRSGPRVARAVDVGAAVRRFLAPGGCERADWVLTYADLQVGALVERLTMVRSAGSLPAPQVLSNSQQAPASEQQ